MVLASPAFRVLGPVEVSVGSERVGLGDRQQTLLAVLLSNANRPVGAGALMDAAWDGGGDRTSALHTQISRLRRLLDEIGVPATLETRPSGYALVVPGDEIDARRFEALTDAAARAGDAATTARLLGDALSLWRGPAYGELADLPALEAESVRLDELRAAAIESRGAALVESGNPEAAIPELESFVRAHPLRERGSESLMRALYACGRQSDALRHYQRHRERLADELGIEPSVALQRLELEILQQEVVVPGSRAAPVRTPAPLDELQLSYLRRPDGQAVAHATLGEGPPMVSAPAWVTSLEVIAAGRDPRSSLLERLAHHVRLTMYDRLGTGLSPGLVEDFSLRASVDELVSVLEQTGPAALLAMSQAGPMALVAAAERPELVTHLVLFGTFASAKETFPDERTAHATTELLHASWGLGSRLLAGLYRPASSDEVAEHLASVMRESAPKEVAAGYLEEMFRTDVSAVLESVTVPALVLHYTEDRVIPFRGGQHLASGLPGSTFVPLTGPYHLPDVGDLDRIVGAIAAFVAR